MSEEHIIRRSLNGPRPIIDKTRIDAITDREIRAGIAADPDAAPELDEDWFATARMAPGDKVPVTIRIDRDIVDFFRGYGKGYQTRMNRVLRAFMEHEQRTNR